jgi:ferrous iron transport protein B
MERKRINGDFVAKINNMNKKITKEIVVALLGNPNSGKTSLFNALVGANQKVGNFSGVTIEKHEGYTTYNGYKIKIIDLPGTYSLTAYSPEELIARNYIIEEKPDVVIDVVDGSSIERNLYLTTQVMELESDMIIALNMSDEIEKQGTKIDIKHLQNLLGSHIILTSAVNKTGIKALLEHIVRVYSQDIRIAKNKLFFRSATEEKINEIIAILETEKQLKEKYNIRWLAIKLLENDKEIYSLAKEFPIWIQVELILQNSISEFKQHYQSDPEMSITEDRHAFILGALKETVKFQNITKKSITEHIDSFLINRILGLPIFLGIMWLVFQFTFKLGNAPMGWIESLFKHLATFISSIMPAGMLESIIVDGVIAGVGGVLVFLPNIILLFIALSFLEGVGYTARAAFVIDKIMHKVGLHGKSFIPMITGFGCSVPAIMATRTLKSRSDRSITMMIIPFMSCGAKLPVYVLLISAFFSPGMAGNILFAIYIFGIIIALLSAKLLKSVLFKGISEPFVMELPPYRLPTLKSILFQAKIKAELYLKKAGTIILAASLIIWVITNFPQNKALEDKHENKIHAITISQEFNKEQKNNLIAKLELQKQSKLLEESIAGRFGKLIEPAIKPLGYNWKLGIALTSGLAAKEIVVSTLGTIYALGDVDEESVDLAHKLRNDPEFTIATALSLMAFVLLYIPCVAAISVFRKEAGGWKLVAIFGAYSMSIAWIVAFIVYRLALFFT